MAGQFLEIYFTPPVQAAQKKYYGEAETLPPQPGRDWLSSEEVAFIEGRDSFYLATVASNGWPYIQHRGGPPGFLKVTGRNRLVFADYRGNQQLLSTGNIDGNGRVALFLMDYPQRTRLKLMGHARVLDAREHPELARQLAGPVPAKQVERIFEIEVVSYDWNCPKHITPRYTAAEIEEAVAPLHARIAELEAQLKDQH